MILPPSSDRGTSLIAIECGLTLVAIAAAFCWPKLGSSYFYRIERAFERLARKQGLAVIVVGAAALLLRLAILPLCPIPLPFSPNDFSFLLASDTFASGRLTNPTPAMWVHFESIHISMTPTYMSMYFPAQGLVLAASKMLFGQPWYGLLCFSALMCAGICWMLQAWLPPTWALLGGILAVVHLGLFSYWINTYHAAGSIAALGGALVLGALPRLKRTVQLRDGLLMAVGVVLLVITRPYEGMLLCLPVGIVLGRWLLYGKKRPSTSALLRCAVAPLALIVAAGAWMGYYDYRAFGSPVVLPYTLNRAAYAMAPYFAWQPQRPEPSYRHKAMRNFYYEGELRGFEKFRSPLGFFSAAFVKAVNGVLFFTGIALLLPLIMLRRVLMDRRIRFLVLCVLVLTAGMAIEIFLLPHYLAPFTAAFYAIGLQAMRHLRLWSPEGRPVGMTMVRLTVTVCFVMAGLRLCAEPLHLNLRLAEWPASEWNVKWYGPGQFGTERAHIEAGLERLPGRQLVIVRYSPDHYPFDEWVYNAADIDGSKVIWAREMDPANDLELIHYYKDRKVWLVQPDKQPAEISPYTVSGLEGFASR
jgi:hypothetical protein